MKRISWAIIFLILNSGILANAQTNQTRMQAIVVNGDTMPYMVLRTAWIIDNKRFSSDLERYRYNQLKHNIRVVFPYVKEAGRIFREIDGQLATLSPKEKKKYIKQKEEELRIRFEDPLSKLYDTQGRLLILLINRETGNSCYRILKEVKNPVKAAMYETTAISNGMSLTKKYDPKEYRDEEEIMQDLEYEYGYYQ